MTPLRVISAGILWRMFGARRSAQTLIDAVSGDDEQNRMLAGMSLVRAGQRSLDLIAEKIDAGEATPPVVRLLPDIDERKARDILSRLAGDNGELADTARQCIDTLDRLETFIDD